MRALGKKLDAVKLLAEAGYLVAQAWGIWEDKKKAKRDEEKDRRIRDLEAQVNLLKLQVEGRK